MPKEKVCHHCERMLPIGEFVNSVGTKNPRGRTCLDCYQAKEQKAHEVAISNESEKIPKLKIMFGEFWKHYAWPQEFELTLYAERSECPYCGAPLGELYEIQPDGSYGLRRNHLDHMDPLNLGGEDSIRNAVFCCRTCNLKKGRRSFSEWLDCLTPDCREIAKKIYTEKHGHPPNEFVPGKPVARSSGVAFELMLEGDELREMYPEPVANGPPEPFEIVFKLPE